VRNARTVVFWLTALIALLAPASAAPARTTAGDQAPAGLSGRLLADASWHGRPIQRPSPTRRVAVRAEAADHPTLGRGSGFTRAGGSERVRRLQRDLTRLGYRPGRIDGLFGPRTQAAVTAFQRKHGLPQTGVAGSVSLRILRRRTAERPAVHVAQATSATQSHPSQTAATADTRTAAPVSTDAGVQTTPLMLALDVTALLGLSAVAARLAVQRRERRVRASRRTGVAQLLPPAGRHGRAIGYAAGRQSGRRALRRLSDGDPSTVVVSALDHLGAKETGGVRSTAARAHGSVIALDIGGQEEAAASRGREVANQGGRRGNA
jgi:peptidoglycan hydrolase-like protein with peptidoglycan-binding domain